MTTQKHKITGIRDRRTLAETFAGKNLLVTGTSGFLGKVWLGMVLDYLPEVGKIVVVLRGKKDQSAEERFVRIFERSPVFRPLRERLGQELRTLIADKIELLDGRLTEPFAGMDEKRAAEVMRDIDAVVHFAGLTDFEPDPQDAIDANIHGAWNMADLAALSRGKRYIHVSTTYVAGVADGRVEESITAGISPNGTEINPRAEVLAMETLIRAGETKKERLAIARARAAELGFQNVYTYTKSLSEHLIEERTDVKTTTFRPAIVECARSYPFAGWNEGINTSGPLVWLLSTPFRRLPAKNDIYFDVVPVDTVARSMVLVVGDALRDDAEDVYQCGSGYLNPLMMHRAMDLTTLALRRTDGSFFTKIDSYCMDNAVEREQIFGYARMRQASAALRNTLRNLKLERKLPPSLYERLGGDKLGKNIESFRKTLRGTEKMLGMVDKMLRQYRPFIYDYSYLFVTENLKRASARLSDEDRALFGFDVETIDWRYYWSKVQVPGLEKWSIPLLKGETVPDDEALPPASDGVRTKGALREERKEIRATVA